VGAPPLPLQPEHPRRPSPQTTSRLTSQVRGQVVQLTTIEYHLREELVLRPSYSDGLNIVGP
ncbi:MAG TPA: hypothetical protein VLA19_05540, partial [Herpetosiphonaceae bacterium]|nr:hypothetical protein [Herpetosiphonaceae bacterium]